MPLCLGHKSKVDTASALEKFKVQWIRQTRSRVTTVSVAETIMFTRYFMSLFMIFQAPLLSGGAIWLVLAKEIGAEGTHITSGLRQGEAHTASLSFPLSQCPRTQWASVGIAMSWASEWKSSCVEHKQYNCVVLQQWDFGVNLSLQHNLVYPD